MFSLGGIPSGLYFFWNPVAVHILFRKTTVCHPADSLCGVGSLVIEVWIYMIKWVERKVLRKAGETLLYQDTLGGAV